MSSEDLSASSETKPLLLSNGSSPETKGYGPPPAYTGTYSSSSVIIKGSRKRHIVIRGAKTVGRGVKSILGIQGGAEEGKKVTWRGHLFKKQPKLG